MALIRHLEPSGRAPKRMHTEVEATFCVVTDEHGKKCLQIDTYGSKERQELGKQSQTIRFAPEAIDELKRILSERF